MGYVVKLQKVQRPTNRSFYVNLPAALADAVQLDKGEELEWFVEDKNLVGAQERLPVRLVALRLPAPLAAQRRRRARANARRDRALRLTKRYSNSWIGPFC
jgi:antitoxin component of MazEF toxin-antitoxin module